VVCLDFLLSIDYERSVNLEYEMKYLNLILVALVLVNCFSANAVESLPQLTAQDGCANGEYVYALGAKAFSIAFERDPITHKMIGKPDVNGMRMECVIGDTPKTFKWRPIDKIVDGKVIRALDAGEIVAAKPIGLVARLTPEEIRLGLRAGTMCDSPEGASSIGGIIPSSISDKFYRCVRTYDKDLKPSGAAWIELGKRNGELVTVPY
jgi:hypothetical protein